MYACLALSGFISGWSLGIARWIGHWHWAKGCGFRSQPFHLYAWLWANCTVHTRVPVTKQCNLVLCKERWCSVAVKVTAGIEEINNSLLPGLRFSADRNC